MLLPLALLACCAVMLNGCAAKRANQLQAHQDTLLRIAASEDATPEEKLDALAGSAIGMMNEAMRIARPRKGARYVRSYVDMNEQPMEQIFRDVVAWQRDLSPQERSKLGLRLLGKPYTRELVMLVPKFISRYRAYRAAARFGNKLKNGLLDVGRNANPLNDLFGGGNGGGGIFNFEAQ